MKQFWKPLIAGGLAIATLGASAAWAKPAHCADNHDHRSHAADYYSYYSADKYSRAGSYRSSNVRFSISFGDDDHYDRRDRSDRRYRDRNDYGRRNGYRGREGRIVNRETYDTRFRARIVLIEEVVRTRRGPRLLCTVKARGPQADYVPKKRLRRIARRDCSRRAKVRILA